MIPVSHYTLNQLWWPFDPHKKSIIRAQNFVLFTLEMTISMSYMTNWEIVKVHRPYM